MHDIGQTFNAARKRYCVQSGSETCRNPIRAQRGPSTFETYNGFEATPVTRRLATIAGASVTALALGLRNPDSFSETRIRMPVMRRFAPDGLESPLAMLMLGVMAQQVVQVGFAMSQPLVAAALLLMLRPKEAVRAVLPLDGDSAWYNLVAQEWYVLPLLALSLVRASKAQKR